MTRATPALASSRTASTATAGSLGIFGLGYDHHFVLKQENAGTDSLALAVRVYGPTSGRVMEVYTTEPGLQFY